VAASISVTKTPFGVALKAVGGLRSQLADPEDVLKRIGMAVLKQAQLAFVEQRLGATTWKRRYPNQKPPLLNIAGALSDFNQGRKEPIPNQYVGRPAGRQTSLLYNSLYPKNSKAMAIQGGTTVEVGSTLPYAGLIQYGGISRQPVSDGAKKKMAAWMKKLGGARRKAASYNPSTRTWGEKGSAPKKKRKKAASGSAGGSKVKSGKAGTPKKAKQKTGGGGGAYKQPKNSLQGGALKKFTKASAALARAQKMGYLFNRSVLKTKVVPRPFLGITPVTLREIKIIVEKGLQNGNS